MSEQAVLTAARDLVGIIRAARAKGMDVTMVLTPPTLQAMEALKEAVRAEMTFPLPPEQERT